MAKAKPKICRSEFDARAEVFERISTDDGGGGFVVTWSSRGSIFCKVVQANASEGLDKDGLATQRRVSFFTSYRSDIVETDRITLDGLNHNIVSVTRVDESGGPSYRGQFLKVDTDSAKWFGV